MLVVATADDFGLVVALLLMEVARVLLGISLMLLCGLSVLLVLLEGLSHMAVWLVIAERRLTAELLRVRVGLVLIVLVSHLLTRILRGLRVFLCRVGRLLLESLILVILVLMLWHKLTVVRLVSMSLVGHVVPMVLREWVRHVCAVVRVCELRRLFGNALAHQLGRLVEAACVELFLRRVGPIGVALEDLGVRGGNWLVRRLLGLRWVLGAFNLRRFLLSVLRLLRKSGAVKLLGNVLGRLASIELGRLLVND